MRVFALEGTNGKAIVTEESGVSKLTSYITEVATYDKINNTMKVNGWYSLTTVKHINEFLQYHGFDKCTKQELIKKYNLTK